VNAPSFHTRHAPGVEAARSVPTSNMIAPQPSIRESFARYAAEERAKAAPVTPIAEPDTLDPYGDTDWPEDLLFRAAPYHGWPL
jgi:hypothetical protein